jgi:alanine-glyoxylate transaminase/serine-glyoxylate transaminase/serine-pyruvate transaminase
MLARRCAVPGRPFLQIPGPTLVPERIVRAMSESIIDHRGPRFAALISEVLAGLRTVFQTGRGHIVVYPGSGTGGWEAAVVNTLSPGDRVLGCVNGHFSSHFARVAAAHGVEVERLEVPYGAAVPADRVAERLRADPTHELAAVLVVHNETSTGVRWEVDAILLELVDKI